MEARDSLTHNDEFDLGNISDNNVATSRLATPSDGSASLNNVNGTTIEDPSVRKMYQGYFLSLAANSSFQVGVRLVLEHQTRALKSGTEVIFAKSMGDNPPPIVSAEEIKATKDLYPDRIHGSKILQLSGSRILKVGRNVGMGEAEALCLVSEKTSVPVPQLHNAYTIGDVGYILMDLVQGIPLTDCWDRMSDEEQQSIVEQLRMYVNELRSIEGEFIGAVDGGPCDEVLFKHPWRSNSPTYGPFWSRRDFNKGVAVALRKSRPDKVFSEADKALEAAILASGSGCLTDRKIMTHGDLNRGNIMVKEGSVTGIVDWGAAGYSIPEMEYFGAKLTSDETSWDTAIKAFIPAFEKEYDFWQKVNNQMTIYTGI